MRSPVPFGADGRIADRLATLRAAGVKRAHEMFDIRQHARRVEAFYLETLERRPG